MSKMIINQLKHRSSHRRCSVRKGVLRNFAKFTGKHLCQSFFINKEKKRRKKSFIKKETLAQVLSCEFCEISKNNFPYRTPPGDCFCKTHRIGMDVNG